MTHDELKVLIEEKFNNQSPLHDAQIVNSLYRVVELHKPWESKHDNLIMCDHCCSEIYPCPTIQTIQKEII
jgi:hypothetical protein